MAAQQQLTMHGRPREAKHKLREPKAAEAYKKKARTRGRMQRRTAPPGVRSAHAAGRPHTRGPLPPHATQVDAIRQGTALVLECRRLQRYDPPALAAAAKLLKVVPEVR